MKVLLTICGLLILGFIPVKAQTQDWQSNVGLPATQARAQWQELTKGDDLALGKKVSFLPSPNYPLTTDTNDPYDLTDGTLSSRLDDRIWFNKDAVGWMYVETPRDIWMTIDLGSEQAIGRIAVRALGGMEQGSLGLPASVEFLASDDGRQYHSLHKLARLDPAEKEESKLTTGFYVPETGKAFMYPFVCDTAVKARYVALRIKPNNFLFLDQISVLKADDSKPLKTVNEFPPAQVYADGLVVMPRHRPLTVTTNITTPNWLTLLNFSGLDPKSPAGFRMELPAGLKVLSVSKPGFKKISTENGANVYEFDLTGKSQTGSIGPLWIEKESGAQIPTNATVTISAMLQGKESHTVTYPLQLVDIPAVPPLKNLDISLAWMLESEQQNWPNFLRDFKKLGFNSISTFPRYYESQGTTQKNLEFIKEAREQGYRVIYNESPFHVMWSRIQADTKAGKIDGAQAKEIYNQIDGKRGQWMNILYRGKYFQDEVKRIASLAALVQPDEVYFDIEWGAASVAESKNDPRVIAAWKASGKTWDDFATDQGRELLGTIIQAMRDAVPDHKLIVGSYDVDPKNAIYEGMLGWNKLYPNSLNIAQPYLYIQGRPQIVADRVRLDYDAMQTRQIIPWLTAGTFGEFDPRYMEPMLLESILNGARGVTYYTFSDFDPMDFYYHSKALNDLAPYEKLLQNGKPIAYKGDNPDLHYTAFATQDEALVLVGNYGGSSKTKVNLPLPFKSATKVLLDGKTVAIKNNTISLTVPEGEFRLMYFSK